MSGSLACSFEDANASLIASKKLDAVERFLTKDYVAHVAGIELTGGHDTVRSILDALSRAFPGIDVEVEILIAGNDRVAWQRTLRGTQSGMYKGFPASDREIVWRDMVTSRFRDGLICEEWVVTDLAEQLLLARKK